MASLTLFQQIVAGDSWGAISLPLAEAHPWTSPILFAILMTISLGVMNLRLGQLFGIFFLGQLLFFGEIFFYLGCWDVWRGGGGFDDLEEWLKISVC